MVTGDSGNGLTEGVIVGKLIADVIEGEENPGAQLYSPSRIISITKSAASVVVHDVQANA
jgi:glycine/D-amino acid oxidase-like deaminating enzyme